MSDYLSEEQQLAQLKSVWQRYGIPLLLALVLAGGAFAGWRWLESRTAAEVAAASERYDAFLETDGATRSALLEELQRDYGDTGYAALALLARASDSVAEGELAAAASVLEEAAAAAPDPALADLAQVRLARVRQQLGDTDAALAALGAVRGAGYRPLALELKGDIHMERGERAEAHKAYLAARDALPEGVQRPLLAMKVTDTADALRPDPDGAGGEVPATAPAAAVEAGNGDDAAAAAAEPLDETAVETDDAQDAPDDA